MHSILIVAEGKPYLPMSIKEKLESASYRVYMVPPNTDAINRVKKNIHCVLIYGDKELIEKQEPLIFLKDLAIMDEIPIFTSGDAGELMAIKVTIPQDLIRQEFLRPIRVNEMVEAIDNFMKQQGTLEKKKILVVDDSGAMLRNVKGWLGEKYNVMLANSATMAIKYLATNRPELILLDYEMPVCDGKQVLEMIRAEMEFNDIPVMFLTNRGDKETIMAVMALKPEGYLLKSLAPSVIVKTVDDFFEKRKGRAYMRTKRVNVP